MSARRNVLSSFSRIGTCGPTASAWHHLIPTRILGISGGVAVPGWGHVHGLTLACAPERGAKGISIALDDRQVAAGRHWLALLGAARGGQVALAAVRLEEGGGGRR